MKNVALFEDALRAAVPARPDPELRATLVPRLAALARAATLEAETHPLRTSTAAPRSRFALVARVGIAVALIPLVLAGLAFAGVTVPGPARSAFDSIGITLPNQPSSDKEGTSSENGSGSETKGNETKGNDVSNSDKPTAGGKGRSEAAHKHAQAQHDKAKGKALGHEKGKAIGLNGSTPPGQTKSQTHEPPAHSNAGGGGNASTTHTTPIPPTPPLPTTPGNSQGHSK